MSEMWKHADALVRAAMGRGMRGAEALVVDNHLVRASSTDRRLVRSSERHAFVRLYGDGGMVGVASRALPADPREALAALVEAAHGELQASDAAPAPRLDVADKGLGILDPRQALLDDAQRAEVLEDALEDIGGVDPRVVAGELVYEEVVQDRGFASSRGAAHGERSTRYRLSGSAWTRGNEAQVVRGAMTSRNFAEVASKPLGVDLGRRALARATSAPLPASRVPIALTQQAVAELLPRLARAFRGERVEAGRSFLAGRVGRQIAGDRLHIVEDAALPGGYATRSFDDRGVPATPVNLVKEGLVGGLYQGVEAARRADARPSGHETWDGGLWLGNLIVRAGNRSRNMIFPEIGTLVLVDDILDMKGTDAEAGVVDLRVVGHRYESTEAQGCCGELRLRCTVEALLGSVIHVLNDQERWGVVDTPTWIVDGPWFS